MAAKYSWSFSVVYTANGVIICYRSHPLQEPETSADNGKGLDSSSLVLLLPSNKNHPPGLGPPLGDSSGAPR